MGAASGLIDRLVLGMPPDPLVGPESLVGHRRSRPRDRWVPGAGRPLDREALPALRASALEHDAAPRRGHPDKEAVRALPAPVVRLKGALHRNSRSSAMRAARPFTRVEPPILRIRSAMCQRARTTPGGFSGAGGGRFAPSCGTVCRSLRRGRLSGAGSPVGRPSEISTVVENIVEKPASAGPPVPEGPKWRHSSRVGPPKRLPDGLSGPGARAGNPAGFARPR